jgi:hypothetical protein
MSDVCPENLTVCILVDKRTVQHFALSWPTWLKHHPWLANCHWELFEDSARVELDPVLNAMNQQYGISGACNHLEWTTTYGSQREKMLTSWVFFPPATVTTKYWCKIDCDAVCQRAGNWPDSSWFDGPEVVVAPGCGRTVAKPRKTETILDWCLKLEHFGDEAFDTPRLGLMPSGEHHVSHKRWKSWLSFYNTQWTCDMADRIYEHCGGFKLPVPSQDTMLAYCTLRGEYPFRTVAMDGWINCPRDEHLKKAVEISMGV